MVVVASLLFMEGFPKALRWPVRLLFWVSVIYLAIAIFQKLRSTKFEAKKVLFSLVLVGILYGALFLVCTVFVKLMAQRDERMASEQITELTDKTRTRIRSVVGESLYTSLDEPTEPETEG